MSNFQPTLGQVRNGMKQHTLGGYGHEKTRSFDKKQAVSMVRSSAHEHSKNIFASINLQADSVIRKYSITDLAQRFFASQTGVN